VSAKYNQLLRIEEILGKTLYMEASSNHSWGLIALDTRTITWVFVFVVVVAFGIALLLVPLMHQRHAMQADIALLDREIAQQDALEKKQKTEIEALKPTNQLRRACRAQQTQPRAAQRINLFASNLLQQPPSGSTKRAFSHRELAVVQFQSFPPWPCFA